METAQLKIELRKRIEGIRSAIPESERRVRSEHICRRVLQQNLFTMESDKKRKDSGPCKIVQPLTVMTYMPFKAEVDVTPVMLWCWSRGYRVVVPKVIRQQKQFQLHEITSTEDLEIGSWGIREPKAGTVQIGHLSEISLILVPGVAFDSQGGRLGYGGGYYDRFIRQLQIQGLVVPPILAPAYSVQLVPEIPMEEHDSRVDLILTEDQAISTYWR